ncbi:hypothetical protein ACWF94_34415, partial [Streptomyces sp. NPDC055078]
MTTSPLTDPAHTRGPGPGAPALDQPGPPVSPGGWDARSDALLARPVAKAPRERAAPRRGPADPVKALMHRHR